MNRTITWTAVLTLALAGVSHARAGLSNSDYRRIVSQLRAMPNPTARRVRGVLQRYRGDLEANKVFYLYSVCERRVSGEEEREAILQQLIPRWAMLPGRRLSNEGFYLAYASLKAAATDGRLAPSELLAIKATLRSAGLSISETARSVNRVSRFRAFRSAIPAGRQAPPPPRPAPRSPEGPRSAPAPRAAPAPRGSRQRLLQEAIVKAVRGLVDFQGHVRMRFALSANTNLDPKYFRRDSRSFVLQRGVRASQALDALYKDLENYGFECATAISIVHYAAIRDVLRQLTGSDAEFDRRFKDLRIGQLTMGTENDVREARSYVRGQIQVGDHGYFSTPDVDPTARLNGWNGENVIYLGDGRYFGHPFGISDAKTIISHLNRQRRQGLRNPRPATLQSGQWRLEASDLFVR